MTNKEAIELLHPETTRDAIRTLESHGVDREQIIKKIEEACEIACEALKKQIPKKPKKVEDFGIGYADLHRCPLCGKNFTGTGISDFCYHCGQALDWSKEE